MAFMTVEDVQKALRELDDEEETLNGDIENMLVGLSLQPSVEKELKRARESLASMQDDAHHLKETLGFSAQLADSVSGKIRHLDLAKQRVEESLQRIEDLLDLRFCTEGVQTAMQNEDYEIAAGHIHRFLRMDESLLQKSAEDMQQQNSLKDSLSLLHQAQQKLKDIINSRFDEALSSGDMANVERLFKIFPLLNLHDHGLRKFGLFLCSDISDHAESAYVEAQEKLKNVDFKRSSAVFVDLITKLVEYVAKIVEMYQPLVETYYGSGCMFRFVKHIQKECDIQGVKIVTEFANHRRFKDRARQIELLLRKTNKSAHSNLRTVIDPLELDALLVEVTVMNTRVDLYLRFIQRKLILDFSGVDDKEDDKKSRLKEVRDFLASCDLSRSMQELIGNYITIEEYYMRQSVNKAVTMEQIDDNALTSSMVDDVFFVVRKSVRRALSSNSVDGICAVLNHAVTLLQEDFADVLHSKLKNNTYVVYTIDLSQAYYSMLGTNTPVDMNAYDKNRKTFLSHFNDADVSMDYVKRLAETLKVETQTLLPDITEHERDKIQSTLSDLGQASQSFQVVVDFAVLQLHTAVLKPRLKPLVDAFTGVSHTITEDEFAAYENSDPFMENFIFNVRTLLGFFETALTKNNYNLLIKYVGTEISDLLEKTIVKQKYNKLGGIQLDKELRSLINYLSSTTDWSIRDKYSRITQIVTILNVETLAEFLEIWNPSSGLSLSWRLTPSEVRQVLQLRIDFRTEVVKRLKL